MALIESPDDVGAAVVLLPDGQRPYGVGCPLGLPIQSVFFHFDVDAASVRLICDEGFIKSCCLGPILTVTRFSGRSSRRPSPRLLLPLFCVGL